MANGPNIFQMLLVLSILFLFNGPLGDQLSQTLRTDLHQKVDLWLQIIDISLRLPIDEGRCMATNFGVKSAKLGYQPFILHNGVSQRIGR